METDLPYFQDHYSLDICTLRRLTPKDAEPVGKNLVSMEPWLTLGYSPESLARYLLRSDPALNRFVVEVEEQTAGIIAVRYPWLLGPYIELLALYPRLHGRGIGSRILQWTQSQAGPTSRNLWTLVSSFNAAGRSFYERAGFIAIAPLDDLVRSGYSEILLRKSF